MQINKLLSEYGYPISYDRDFMLFLYAQREELMMNMRVVELEKLDDYVYEGDFYGLLDKLNIPKEYHYATLLVNRLKGPITDIENIGIVYIPDTELIDKLKNYYLSRPGYVS